MGSPIDRTNKTALDANLVNGITSDAPKVKSNNDTLYNYVDGLNSQDETHATAAVLAHPDGSVTTAKLANSAVSTAKIADSSVTAAKVADGTLTSAKFVAGALQNETQNALEIIALKAETPSKWFNVVEGYNATGGGVTNDSAAIAAAITACNAAGGGIVYFPPGTYLATITVSNDNIHLLGAGKGVTLIKKPSSAEDTECINISGDGCSLRSLSVLGQSIATYVANERGIYIEGTSASRVYRTLIEDVEVYNIGSSGIVSSYGDQITLSRCYLHDIGYSGATFLSTNNGKMIDCDIDEITPGTSSNAYGATWTNIMGEEKCYGGGAFICRVSNIPIWEGLDTHGGESVLFLSNHIKNCKFGINIGQNDDNEVPHYSKAIGNHMDVGSVATPGRGIGAGGSSTESAKGIVVSENTVVGYGIASSDEEGAITFLYTVGLQLVNNYIEDSTGSAICLYIDNENAVVTGNTINGVTAGTGNASGIKVRITGNSGYVGDNVINSTSEYGIGIEGSNTDLEFGRNRIVTSNAIKILGGASGGKGIEFYDTETENPISLADGAGETLSFTVVGVNFGDIVQVAAPYDLQGIDVTGYVSAANTVSVRVQNESGGTIDLASGDWKIRVIRI